MKRTILAIIFLTLVARSAHSAYQFAADGGTFVTLEKNGVRTTWQMSHSGGGEPAFDGASIGTLSLADGDTLVLTGFDNKTYESGGHDVFGGRFAHRIQRVGDVGTFTTNLSTAWLALGSGYERHFATNLSVNLLAGLTNGIYELEVYALAQGNFDGYLVEDNQGSNFVAVFGVTEDPLPEPDVDFTEHGRVVLPFCYTTNTGFGNELFVVGNHSDIGNWDPVLSRKLHWSSGNVWTGQVAVAAGVALEYKFVIRTNSPSGYCAVENVTWMTGPNLTTNVPAQPDGPYGGKAIYYYSGWTNANVVFQCGQDTNWYGREMARIGPGRTGGEHLYRVDGIGRPGERLSFVLNGWDGASQLWDHSPASGGNYSTPLDSFLLQDGNVYNYWPPAAATPSRIVTNFIVSSLAPTIPSRSVRVYLPRNYDANSWKRYPVLYMHDGQNVFQPGGVFGCWNAETNADALISLGSMRETMIVAVDQTNRSREFIAPGDDSGAGPGLADQYGRFLASDVRPFIDATYRTLTNIDNTVTIGSSFGGNVAVYLGLSTNIFGKIGPFSPAFWAIPNYIQDAISAGDSSGLRIYMDMGTEEGTEMWADAWEVYDLLLLDGYAANHDLRAEIGCGHSHNEAAWDARLPMAYEFLLNIQDEPNSIVQSEHPPVLDVLAPSNGQFRVEADSLKGYRYRLDRSADLVNPAWSGVATSALERLSWSTLTLSDATSPTGRLYYYRVLAVPSP